MAQMAVFRTVFLVALLALVCSAGDPVITVGFIATTFLTDDAGAIVRNDVGAQHLAAFMLAVDEINLSHKYSVLLRPEVSLGNVDYLSSIHNPTYEGASAARDIYLNEALPQVVIVTDTSTKALSAATALQILGVPAILTADRSTALSHASVYNEVIRSPQASRTTEQSFGACVGTTVGVAWPSSTAKTPLASTRFSPSARKRWTRTRGAQSSTSPPRASPPTRGS